jgi:hypothetical protein
MPKNQVQFQRGMSLREFMDRYATREQCEQAQFGWRWPRGFVCPERRQTGYCTLQSLRVARREVPQAQGLDLHASSDLIKK